MLNNNSASQQSGRVLVLGRDIRAFLAVIRSLGRAGLNVHVGMCKQDDIALKSCYIEMYHDIPDYDPAETHWLETVTALLHRYHFDLVIPTNDESLIPIQIHRDKLRELATLYSLNDKAFEIAFDKIKSSVLAEELSIPVPKQQEIDLKNSECQLAKGFSFPVVFKPPSSFVSDNLNDRREVLHVRTQQQLEEVSKKHQNWGQALIQEYFSGIGAGIEILAAQGEVLYAFQHLRVHEPIDGGASSYRKSAALNPEMLDASKRLIKDLDYSGVAMVEYKLNPDTGQWVFIEINARFWGSLPLAISAGANFPLFLYQMLVKRQKTFAPHYRIHIHNRNLLRDLYWMSDNFKARIHGKNDATTVPLPRFFMEFLNVLLLRERIDSFALDDLKPGLAELKLVFTNVKEKLVSSLRRRWLSIPFVRKRNSEKIRRNFADSKNILFVCYGNICRSPFAELYARQAYNSGYTISSSGFHAETDRQSPDQAIQVASEFGIDMASHRSSALNQELVSSADLIFIFDQKNQKAFEEHYPNALFKTRHIGYLLDEGPLEISDPYSGSQEDFRREYKRIVTAIDKLTSF